MGDFYTTIMFDNALCGILNTTSTNLFTKFRCPVQVVLTFMLHMKQYRLNAALMF
jgi:hypothetical protein